AARREGVEVRTGVAAALGPVAGDRRVVRVGRGKGASEVRARVVLDATGLGGGLSDAGVGRPPPIVAPRSRIGMGATFDAPEYPLAPGELHMAIGRAGYVGLVRNETGRLHVAAAVDPQAVRDSASPDALVAAILAEAGLPPLSGGAVAVWRGTPRLTRAPSSVEAERVLRLGDAAGYVEPFTGEGMCWAMSGAVAAAPLALEAVDRWRPGLSRAWSGYHRRALRGAKLLCRVVVPALRHPRVVEAVLAVLGPAPSLAGPFMRRAARRPSLSVVY
ncbi:MAG: NAD-binding protein, partial [Gemmatimonadota bacterium]